MKPLHVYLPRQYFAGKGAFPAFYDKLTGYLDARGVPCRRRRFLRGLVLPRQGCNYLSYHTVSDRAMPNRLHVKIDYVPSYFTIDDTGYSGWSSLIGRPFEGDEAGLLAEAEDVAREYDRIGTKIPSAKSNGETIPKGSVIVVGQLLDDTVARFHGDWREMLEKAIAVSTALGVELCFKPHPKEKGSLRKLVREAFPQIRFYEGRIEPCLEDNIFFVQNSGVGFEAMLKRCPVVSFGLSDYARFTIDGNQPPQEIRAALAAWRPETALAGIGFLQRNRVCANWPEDRFNAKLDAILGPKFFGAELPAI